MLKAEWGLFIFKLVKKYMEAVVKSQGKKEESVLKDKDKTEKLHTDTVVAARKMIEKSKAERDEKLKKAEEVLSVTTKEKEKAQKFAEKLNDFMEV